MITTRCRAASWRATGSQSDPLRRHRHPRPARPLNHTTYLRHTNTQGKADEAWSFAESGWLRVPDVGLDDPSDRLGPSPRCRTAASRTTLWDASC